MSAWWQRRTTAHGADAGGRDKPPRTVTLLGFCPGFALGVMVSIVMTSAALLCKASATGARILPDQVLAGLGLESFPVIISTGGRGLGLNHWL